MIHSGIYYPLDSLKTALCVRGRELLYARCQAERIPYRQTGKLVLATSIEQEKYLRNLVEKSETLRRNRLDVPLEWISGDEVRKLEPDVGDRVVSALLSRRTGIVDSHALMENLERGTFRSRTIDRVKIVIDTNLSLLLQRSLTAIRESSCTELARCG